MNAPDVTRSGFRLNGFRLSFSTGTLPVQTKDMPEVRDVKQFRDNLKQDWFVQWSEGKVYGIAKTEHAQLWGTSISLSIEDHIAQRLLRSRMEDVLPSLFPQYDAFRLRPFTFLGRKDEIVSSVRGRMSNTPESLSFFKIRPRYELEAKIVELENGDSFIGLFMNISTRWEIDAPLNVLLENGLDLAGMYALRIGTQGEDNYLIGRISNITGDQVFFSESVDGVPSASIIDLQIEGSRASFTRCLGHILGTRYKQFEDLRAEEEASFNKGIAVSALLAKMEGILTKSSPIKLSPTMTCTVEGPIDVENTSNYKTIFEFEKVQYCFDAARSKFDYLPWRGIQKYGPFSKDTFPRKSPNILVLTPETIQGPAEQFTRAFRDGVSGGRSYTNGFGTAFGLANVRCLIHKFRLTGASPRDIAASYRRAVDNALSGGDEQFDAAIVLLQDDIDDDSYLATKASLLMAGVPVQAIKQTTLRNKGSLEYILQNISIALYAKMNGTPWTVNHDRTVADEVVIGMGTAITRESRFSDAKRVVGITTVFQGDGNYLLGNVSKECDFDDYPAELRASTLEILESIKRRNGWQNGDVVRLVFHTPKPLRNLEIDDIVSECVKEVGKDQVIEFAFCTVSLDHNFALLDLKNEGIDTRRGTKKAEYVPRRGTVVQVGQWTRVLCTNGPELIKHDKTPLPRPLLIHLHRQSTFNDMTYLTEQVLKFTALSWRSTLPAAKPVTIYYSELIAHHLSRLQSVHDWSPSILGNKLRASRWFL